MRLRSIFLFTFIFVLVLGFGFAQQEMQKANDQNATSLEAKKTITSLYNLCIKSSQLEKEECKEIVIDAGKVSKAFYTLAIGDVDVDRFISCVKSKVDAGIFNYLEIRNSCYSEFVTEEAANIVFSLYKIHCFVDKNQSNLKVTCKSVLPSMCFVPDVDLIKTQDKYVVQPYIKYNGRICPTIINISLTEKEFEVDENLPFVINEYKIVDDNYKDVGLNTVAQNIAVVSEKEVLSQPEKRFLDCLVNKYLHYEFNDQGIYDGNTFIEDKDVVTHCKLKISSNFGVNLNRLSTARSKIKNKVLSAADFFVLNPTLDDLGDFIETVLNYYESYNRLLSNLKGYKGDVSFLSNLSVFMDRVQSRLEAMDEAEKKDFLEGVKVTLLNDLRGIVVIYNRKEFAEKLKLLNNELEPYNKGDLKPLIEGIKTQLIMEYIEKEEVFDLTDLDFVITTNNLEVLGFTFEPKKPVIVRDKNEKIGFLIYNGKIVFGYEDGIKALTSQSLSIHENKVYVDGTQIVLLRDLAKRGLKGTILGVELIKNEEGKVVYVAKKELEGYLLGLFAVKEKVTEYYNAENGNLYDVEKPWWDFLVVYPKSVTQLGK